MLWKKDRPLNLLHNNLADCTCSVRTVNTENGDLCHVETVPSTSLTHSQIIGSIPPLSGYGRKLPEKSAGAIEAHLLHVRPPRKGIAGPSGRERRVKEGTDPFRGRVLTIMVLDATQLPADIDTARYDVSVRLIRR